MEDEEEDMFNNKYLTDLKEGRCLLPAGKCIRVNCQKFALLSNK